MFDLARLAGLAGYSFVDRESNDGFHLDISGRVHSLNDWETTVTAGLKETTHDVDGRGYSQSLGLPYAIGVTFKTHDGVGHLNGEYTNAESLIGITHIALIRIRRSGTCEVAGTAGERYMLQSPKVDSGIISQAWQACIADGSGALLDYEAGHVGGAAAAALNASDTTTSFEVTSIGGVGTISAPHARAAGSAATTVPASLPATASGSIPASSPAEVPVPPGKVFSAEQLGAGKWYLEMSEGSRSTALGAYTATLEAHGFEVTTSVSNVAGDIAELRSASYGVTVEGLDLPGQGNLLVVTLSARS